VNKMIKQIKKYLLFYWQSIASKINSKINSILSFAFG